MSYNVLSKEGLIAWLERQPGDVSYDYMNRADCLGARYCHTHGLGYGREEGFGLEITGYSDPKGTFRQQLEYVARRAEPSIYKAALKVARRL